MIKYTLFLKINIFHVAICKEFIYELGNSVLEQTDLCDDNKILLMEKTGTYFILKNIVIIIN